KNYLKFNNVEEKEVNKRLGITFKRKFLIDEKPTNFKDENFTLLGNLSRQLGGIEVNVSIFSHYQYYFINFLLNKRNPIVKGTAGGNYDTYKLELVKDEELKVELTDNKTIWPNRDKNIFVFINSMLADGLKS